MKDENSKKNLRHWDRFSDIDPKFTKQITGKPYKGTSPNPQYVIKCLTDIFGPVGEGFGWEVVAEDFTPLLGDVLHWCRIKFWHTDRSNTFDSYGQTKAAYVTSGGKNMVDEDAPKKSLTDAIIKAASHIGIASNIFLGRWDDQKYVAQVDATYRGNEPKHPTLNPNIKIADAMIFDIKKHGVNTVTNHPKFKVDFDALKIADAEQAARVEVEIANQNSEK